MKVTISKRGVLMIAALLASAPLHACGKAESETSTSTAGTTPRRADGKPDLNGMWTDRFTGRDRLNPQIDAEGSVVATPIASRTGGLYAAEIDGSVLRKGSRDKPVYKPEHWERVRFLELHALEEDPEFKCRPWGVPRMGEPQQIVHQDNQLVFLYSGASSSDPSPYRVIRLNRPHDPERVSQQTSRGDSVARWEGDTLVVDTIGFNDETWITGRLGYFHSSDMHVVERFTRAGDKIKYEVIVEDPAVLLEPWVWPPRTMTFNPNPDAILPEDFPCSERDAPYTPVR